MKTMHNAIDVAVDVEQGFAWAHDGDERVNLFQACLLPRKDGKGFKKAIDRNDCGHDWGVSGEHNDAAGADEEDFAAFIKLARQCGIKIV